MTMKKQTKPIYYMMETSNANAFCKAEPLKAQNLTAAKREASRKAAFCGTVITIGTESWMTKDFSYHPAMSLSRA